VRDAEIGKWQKRISLTTKPFRSERHTKTFRLDLISLFRQLHVGAQSWCLVAVTTFSNVVVVVVIAETFRIVCPPKYVVHV